MEWWYVRAGERVGPVDEAAVTLLIANGAIVPETLVWREGWPEWRAARATELANRLPGGPSSAAPPPPPVAPPPVGAGARFSATEPLPAVSQTEAATAAAPVGPRDWKWLLLSLQGRATRRDYWLRYVVPYVVIYVIAMLLDHALGIDKGSVGISGVVGIVALWPSIAVGVKRCHDRNKSGWWFLISLIPVVGWIWALIELGCLRGTPGPNRFGPDPLV